MSGPVPYARQVLLVVPRALGLFDRNPSSETRGCGDRQFWYYRTITPFAGATWQQPMLGLALVYKRTDPDNPYAGDGALLDVARAALRWWSDLQHPDGSFDEWYLNEHSYCPTAFSAVSAAETVLELGHRLSDGERAKVAAALEKACAWLRPRFNPAVMNQNLAAALALLATARITGDDRWSEAAHDKLALLDKAQNEEGWFPEYGGMDFGYSTLALDLLAAADGLDAGGSVPAMARRLCEFLVAAAGNGAGFPGRLGSRGTAHVFPFGAEHFAAHIPAAAALAARWQTGSADDLLLGPAQIDDRYFAAFHFTQFARAYAATPGKAVDLPEPSPELSDLTCSGLVVRRESQSSVTISRRLGGALAIEMPRNLPVYDLGYELRCADGTRYCSAWWDDGEQGPVSAATLADGLDVRQRFARVASNVPLVRWMIPFQIIVRLLFVGKLAEAFQSAVKGRMIGAGPGVGIALNRHVTLSDGTVTVTDRITADPGAPRIVAIWPATQISVYSPSAKHDGGRVPAAEEWNAEEAGRRLMRDGALVIERTYRVEDDGVEISGGIRSRG